MSPRAALGLAATFAVCTLVAFSQGVATNNATARPSRPLPKGLVAPKLDYRDIAAAAGLTARNVSGPELGTQYIVETTGNGVALFDYDSDGLLDILLLSAGTLDRKPVRHSLYRNLGNLKFEDATEKAGIRHTGWAQGVCAGDATGDGKVDLLITHWGQVALWVNRGDGTFREEAQARGLHQPARRWSTGCAFLDYDHDGDYDLFVANYVDFDPATTPRPGEKSQCRWKSMGVICGPRGLPAESMTLYRNDGGKFTDVSAKAGVQTSKSYYGFTVLTADFDQDGWTDIYVACDSTASLLFRNKGDGTFEEMGVASGAAYNEDGREQAGMGATAGDYDNDGKLDIFKTNFTDDTPTLYRNEGKMNFVETTVKAGLAVHTKFLGWGTAFFDADLDGWPDLLAVNGHVYPEVDQANIGETYRQRRVLYWNRRDGQFFDLSPQAGPALAEAHSSRGMAAADLDNDGSIEFVIVNMHQAPSLWRNVEKPANHWLGVDVRDRNGAPAIGATVTVTTPQGKRVNEVRSGGYHISQGDFRTHFGLGTATSATVEVTWPGGAARKWEKVAADQYLRVIPQ